MKNTKGIDVTIYALSPDLESDLATALAPLCRDIRTVNDLPRGARVVFCPSNLDDVTRLRAAEPQTAIIVVSRHPEINDWLDAIEAGANDYCAAPFETSQLQWLLQTCQRPVQLAA
jgi:CheY-like chemotaxis protein